MFGYLNWRQWMHLGTLRDAHGDRMESAAALAHARTCQVCRERLDALAVPRRELAA